MRTNFLSVCTLYRLVGCLQNNYKTFLLPLKEDKLGNITDKKRQPNVNTTPIDVRFDGFQHMPEWSQSRQKCKYLGCKGITYICCAKCSKALCFTRSSNCFNKYHMK